MKYWSRVIENIFSSSNEGLLIYFSYLLKCLITASSQLHIQRKTNTCRLTFGTFITHSSSLSPFARLLVSFFIVASG